MKKLLIAFAFLAGCGSRDEPGRNDSAGTVDPTSAESGALTGLYEGGKGEAVDQLCMIGTGPDSASFGLVVWGSNMHSCSGEGQATRRGDRLTLAMAGDSTCRIEATIAGGTITLPATTAAGCLYYCGVRAELANATFIRKGSTAEDAAKARDLAGDRLCGKSGP